MTRTLSQAQRVVIVVALGFAIYFLGQWFIETLEGSRGITGWTGYAPLSAASFTQARLLHPWVILVIWLILIGAWTIPSLAILRRDDRSESSEPGR